MSTIYLPNTGLSADLPISIIDADRMTEADEEMIVAMMGYQPNTTLKPGDICYLTDVPQYLRRRSVLPRMWQVRFVISAWQHELMALVQSQRNLAGMDQAMAMLNQQGLPEAKYTKPIVYCHAFPHGLYPDSASWMPERILKKIPFREMTQGWTTILDEARAPYIGHDPTHLIAPYTYDLAPDLYASGENLGRPFSFEEATVHTAALLGLEEAMWCPVDYQHFDLLVDPNHNVFTRK